MEEEAQDISFYISKINSYQQKKLYTNPIFCISYLKILKEKSTAFIFDLLTSSPCLSTLPSTKPIVNTLKNLKSVNLIEKVGNNIYLNSDFRNSLLSGFCMEDMSYYFFLDDVNIETRSATQNSYEDIIKIIVDKSFAKSNESVKKFILFSKLINEDCSITHTGFEFLLKTKKEQLWFLIFMGIKYLSHSKDEEVEMILSIFELGLKDINKPYKIKNYNSKTDDKGLDPLSKDKTNSVCRLIKLLNMLGLCTIEKSALVLLDEFSILFGTKKVLKDEFLIVETNYKFYAYTTSEHEISILSLFCKINFTLPNLIVGSITEESVTIAFEKEITASQIIHYLKSNVKNGYLPDTISNQISIWESKRNRISAVESYMYTNFLNFSDFEKILNFCKKNSWLLEVNEEARIIVIKVEGHNEVKNFIKENI